MTRTSTRIALAALIAVTLLATGCTGSDTLSTGNVTLSFATQTTNPSGTNYACVLLSVRSLWVRIYDGTCSDNGDFCGDNGDCTVGATCEGALADEVIQGDGISIVLEPVLFQNFTNQGEACSQLGTTAVNIDTTNLSSNRYRIERLQLAAPVLVRPNGTTLACSTYAQEVTPAYPEDTFFELGDSRSNVVSLVIDISELESRIDPLVCDAAGLAAAVTDWFAIQ